MLHAILTMIRLLCKLLFLPVRAALHVLAFALKVLLGLGSVASTILSGVLYLCVIVALMEGCPVTAVRVWLPFVLGLLCSAFPYVGAAVVAVPLAVAELLKRLTSPHPFQVLDYEGGNPNEA